MKIKQNINNFFRQISYTTYIFYLNSKIKKKINFSYSNKSTLKLLFNKYGSDKGNLNNKHDCSIIYEALFGNLRNNNLNLMEVGLGSIDESVEFHMKYMGKNYKPLASLICLERLFYKCKYLWSRHRQKNIKKYK